MVIDLDNQPAFGFTTSNPMNTDINRIAALTMIINSKTAPVKLELDYNKTLFDIQSAPIPLTTGKHSVNLTIRCKAEVPAVKYIRLLAYYAGTVNPASVGILKVNPKQKLFRRTKEFVIVDTPYGDFYNNFIRIYLLHNKGGK